MNKNLIKNKYGFIEFKKKPGSNELKEYYTANYFQMEKGAYQKSYSEEELDFFNNKTEQKYSRIISILNSNNTNKSILDIGCGEGFAIEFFRKKGWDICGIDFSDFGLKKNNPNCLDKLIVGDLFEETKNIIKKNIKYDVIILQNLLEHVLEPEKLIVELKSLLLPNSLIVVTVPNDFNPIQKIALERKKIENEFWVVYPDHLSYFNKSSLKKIFEENGFKTCALISDFPIDIFLLNDNSNYITDKSRGKEAHKARIMFENMIHKTSVEKTNVLYEMLAEFDIGRDITGFFKLK